jgi:hypothetical protein
MLNAPNIELRGKLATCTDYPPLVAQRLLIEPGETAFQSTWPLNSLRAPSLLNGREPDSSGAIAGAAMARAQVPVGP